MENTLLHLIFVVTFLTFTTIRMYYHRKAQKNAGKFVYKEQNFSSVLRGLFGVPYILTLFAYMIFPSILDWAAFTLPSWLRWTGALLSVAVLPMIWWVQWALGVNFSTRLHVREEHTLVTHGPYRWVRHPMYTIFMIQAIGLLLLTANLFIGGIYLFALSLIVVLRTPHEEAAMLEKFGDGYRAYMQKTGRYLPRLG